MTIPEEIEQLKIKLEQTANEKEEAEILLELLKKSDSIWSAGTQPYIDRLLQLAEKLNDPASKAWGLYHLARIKYMIGEYESTHDLSQQAILQFTRIKDKSGMASCYTIIGNLYLAQGNYSEAEKSYFDSLKLHEEIGEKYGIAGCYNELANLYKGQGNYPKALKNHFASLKIKEEMGDKRGIAISYNNIANVYTAQGNYSESLKNHFASLKLKKELGDKRVIANSYNNIGNVYFFLGNYPESQKNHFASLKLREEVGDKWGIASSYNNIGGICYAQHNYPEALKNHFASLKLKVEISDKSGIATTYGNIGCVYEKQGNYPEALKNYLASLKLHKEIGEKFGISGSYCSIGDIYEKQRNYEKARENQLIALKMSEEIGSKEITKSSSLSLTIIYKAIGDFENALKYHEHYHKVESEMLGEQAQKQLINLNFQHNMEQKEKDLEIEQLRNVELKKEKDRSETLLLNILPAEVAEELKTKGTAGAKLFDNVTVLYTDFKSFTTASERLTPQELVDELHACFSAFDEIVSKHNIEKIKTVGDSYIAVSGLPLADDKHAESMMNAAIEIKIFTLSRRKKLGEKSFEIRIGIHSGSVVAGIVGVKKYAYDIWGDTVNTAARMEQNSEAGKINISETTYQLVKDKFKCEYRGEIEAKNKGSLKMYFVS